MGVFGTVVPNTVTSPVRTQAGGRASWLAIMIETCALPRHLNRRGGGSCVFGSTKTPLLPAAALLRSCRGSTRAWFRRERLAEFVDKEIFVDLLGGKCVSCDDTYAEANHELCEPL